MTGSKMSPLIIVDNKDKLRATFTTALNQLKAFCY